MADQKISELTALTGANVADDDAIAIVDTSATETKKIVFSELKNALDTATGFVRITGDTMTGDLNVLANVGIGTDSPTTKLQSKGGSISTPTDNAGLIANASASFVVDHGNDYGIYTGYVNSTNDAVGIAATRTLGGALPLSLQPFGGSVGIGTSSPERDLHINGTAANAKAFARFTHDGLASNGLDVGYSSGGYASIYNAENTPMVFSTNATEAMRIDSSGNVGIGTSSIARELELWNSDSTTYGSTTRADAGANQRIFNISNTNSVYAGLTLAANNGGSTTSEFTIANVSTSSNYLGELVFQAKTGASSYAERMRIDSSGNVGIGTDSPSTTLDLVGNWVSNTGQLSIDTPSGETYSGLAILNNGSAKGFLYHDNSAGTLDLQTYTTDALRFKTNNTEAMRIDSNGNLLVGVASSSANMAGVEIAANGQLYASTSSSSGHFFNISHGNDGNIVSFRKDGSNVGSIGTNSNGNFQLYGTAASHVGLQFGSPSILPINNSGASADNAVDLGDSNVRFKDLYLSGGVVFGDAGGSGTSSSNTFDSYEEGTWAPSFSATGLSGVTIGGGTAGYYTKVGNKVTAWFTIYTTGTFTKGSAALFIAGLPYTSANNTGGQGAISFHNATRFDASPPIAARVDSNSTSIKLYSSINATGAGTDPVSVSSSNMRSAAAENCNFVSGTVTYMV